MMMVPRMFGESLLDDWMAAPFGSALWGGQNSVFGATEKSMMKTDIKEKDGWYALAMDLPGFQKEDVTAQLKEGYLTIRAARGANKDEKSEDGAYVRRERYTGTCARSFYVGEEIRQEDIKAKFENGILYLTFPKAERKKEMAQNQFIAIEG